MTKAEKAKLYTSGQRAKQAMSTHERLRIKLGLKPKHPKTKVQKPQSKD